MGEPTLNLEISPRQMDLINIVQNAWKQEHIKLKIREVYLIHVMDKKNPNKMFRQRWNELEKEIVGSITLTTTQKDLDQDLPFVIKVTGQRICQWFEYMNSTTNLFDRKPYEFEDEMYFGLTGEAFINYCFNEICWTKYGWVDKLKTFSLTFLDKPDVDDFKKFFRACLLCDEPVIDLLWEKLPNDVKNSDHSSYLKHCRTLIVAYWICLKKSTLQTFMDDVNAKYFNENKSVEENFLDLMIDDYYASTATNSAVFYFMKKLNCETLQKNAPIWFRKLCIFSKSLPILLFLYNEMSEGTRQIAFMLHENKKSALTFLELLTSTSAYPFQELLAPALSQLKSYLSNSDYALLFMKIVKNEMLLKLLPVLWNILPASAKKPTAEMILRDFFEFWDVQNLKIILNDTDLREKREILIRIGYKKFMDLVRENKFDMINSFVDKILIPEDWEDGFKVKVKKIYKILMIDLDVRSAEEYLNSEFSRSDSYLNLISSFLSTFIFSENDRKNFLKNINHELLLYYFFKKERLELIREYFEKIYPDDLKTFKGSIKNNPFTLDLIYEIWFSSKGPEHKCPENLCNEFLFWMFDSKTDDVATFRKNVMLKDLRAENWRKLKNLFSMSNRFDMIHNFLSWSCCTEKEIRKIKSELLRYAVPKKFEDLMEKDDLVTCKKLLDWAFKSEKNKRKFKSRFISSRKGITALIILIASIKSQETDPNLELKDISRKFKDYIEFWMESLEDMAVIPRYLEEYCDVGKTEADLSDDESDLRKYFLEYSISFKTADRIKNYEKNLVLFRDVLDVSMKEKLRAMKMSK